MINTLIKWRHRPEHGDIIRSAWGNFVSYDDHVREIERIGAAINRALEWCYKENIYGHVRNELEIASSLIANTDTNDSSRGADCTINGTPGLGSSRSPANEPISLRRITRAEAEAMDRAFWRSVEIIDEPLVSKAPFDFGPAEKSEPTS